MKNHGNWRKEVPEWWPEDVDFRSPNVRNPALIREELDSIIESVQHYVRALAGENQHSMEAEADEDAEAEESGEAQAIAMAPNVGVAVNPVEQTEWTTGNEDTAAVATAVATAVDVAECNCKEFEACSGNLYCCIFDEMPVPHERDGLHCIVCATCSRHYHKLCIGSSLDAGLEENGEWSCGCIIRPAYLTRLEGLLR